MHALKTSLHSPEEQLTYTPLGFNDGVNGMQVQPEAGPEEIINIPSQCGF